MAEILLTVAHTPDSDDAFMFHGLFGGRVDRRGLKFRSVVQDIEALNRAAEKGRYDVTALSLHAYAYVCDRYLCSRVGASVGDGYGPLVLSREPLSPRQLEGRRVAIPGTRTTAALLFRLFAPRCETLSVPFDQVCGAVLAGDADAGVSIHEAQLTYHRLGLHKVADLGEWWKEETGSPVVLGVVGVRRSLDPGVRSRAMAAVKESVEFSLRNREAAMRSARRYARGMEEKTLNRFVSMYVNAFTVDLGESGVRAAELLLRLAGEREMIPAGARLELA